MWFWCHVICSRGSIRISPLPGYVLGQLGVHTKYSGARLSSHQLSTQFQTIPQRSINHFDKGTRSLESRFLINIPCGYPKAAKWHLDPTLLSTAWKSASIKMVTECITSIAVSVVPRCHRLCFQTNSDTVALASIGKWCNGQINIREGSTEESPRYWVCSLPNLLACAIGANDVFLAQVIDDLTGEPYHTDSCDIRLKV